MVIFFLFILIMRFRLILKSPILQSLSKKKDYFVVPMQAILPLNWEKFYTNPNIGQDVPLIVVLVLLVFGLRCKTLFLILGLLGLLLVISASISCCSTLKFLLFFENIYSWFFDGNSSY